MTRLLPRMDWGRWGGPTIDGDEDCSGYFLVVEWLGVLIEIGCGRVGKL